MPKYYEADHVWDEKYNERFKTKKNEMFEIIS